MTPINVYNKINEICKTEGTNKSQLASRAQQHHTEPNVGRYRGLKCHTSSLLPLANLHVSRTAHSSCFGGALPPGSRLSATNRHKENETSEAAEIIFGKYFRSRAKARPP
jgi:hypothetical protein